jgi:serine/threonine-protein kinase RsbW
VSTQAPGPGLSALEDTLRDVGLSDDVVLDLRLVAEEIVTNVGKYGHDVGGEHFVRVGLALRDGELTLRFVDDGRVFDPLSAPPADLDGPPEARPIGSLGLHLVRSLVDAAAYERVGVENVLTLRRRVAPPRSGPGVT